MAATTDSTETNELPTENIKNAVKIIAVAEKFKDYHITVSDGSAKGDNFLGVILRVKIHGNRNGGKRETLHLIVKTPPEFKMVREMIPLNSFYYREVYAYTVLLPALNKLQDESNIPKDQRFGVAKCFEASSDDLEELLVFEDLSVKGYKMCDRLKSLDYDHTRLIINNLANYHALSFAMKERDPDMFNTFIEHTSTKKDFGDEERLKKSLAESQEKAISAIDDPECAKRLSNYCQDTHKKLYDYLDLDGQDCSYNIITHGDCWTNNFLFKYKEDKPTEMMLLDWQIIRHASPVTDLAYLIFTSTDEEFRERYLEEVFDMYYGFLGSRLAELNCDVKKCYPEEVFRRHIKGKLLSGLLWALVLVPLVLGNRHEAVDLSDLVGAEENNTDNIKMSDSCIERLRGIVRDFIKYKMI